MIRKTRGAASHEVGKRRLTGTLLNRANESRQHAGGFGASLKPSEKRWLDRFSPSQILEVCFDAGEQIEEGVADVANNHDNGDADAGGNQAIFNGGDAGLVLEKMKQLRHDFTTPY
jgi:hypothetical protein